jgi:hypothetical protein
MHARSPDGREWVVTIHRVELPVWPESRFDPDELAWSTSEVILATVVLGPIFWFVIPLLRVLAALPLALARGLVTTTRWVEAECRWPSEIRIRWQTSRERATEVAAEITRRLGAGYSDLTPGGASLVSMTEPPGFGDLSA